MADDKETRAGLLSGLFAVIMVIALSVMALTALQPPQPSEIADERGGGGGAAHVSFN
jgi:hypothetical protein